MKTMNALVGSAVIAIMSTATAGAATLVPGSDIALAVSGALSGSREPQFGGPPAFVFTFEDGLIFFEKPSSRPSATVTVGDAFAQLFLNSTEPNEYICSGIVCTGTPITEDYRITASVDGLTFTALDSHRTPAGVGAAPGEFFEVLNVSGLAFQNGHTLSDAIIEGVGDGVSLPTLIGVTDSGVWLDLASLGVNAPNTAFTISFVTEAPEHAPPQAVPLPATAPLTLAGLGALHLVRRRGRDA